MSHKPNSVIAVIGIDIGKCFPLHPQLRTLASATGMSQLGTKAAGSRRSN